MKYSFLLSVYKDDKESYLYQSIRSMILQTIPPDEIVVVFDGPLDRTLENVVLDFSSAYPSLFNIVRLPKNIGLGLASNEGLKHARNELIARMDADDICVFNRCEMQIEQFKADNSLVVCGSHVDEFFDNPENIVSTRKVPLEHKDILKFSKRRNPFNHPTVMFKKSYVLELDGYRDFKRNQDYDLLVRMINKGFKTMNIDKSLLLFRANSENLRRRKSFENVRSKIQIVYNFWKSGNTNFYDFISVVISHIIIFLMPSFIFSLISKRFLRESSVTFKE
jgi:glycosyltransferase involved in cell wall biosynthesis